MSWWKLTVLFALLVLSVTGEAATITIRGRRGPIVPNNDARLLKARTLKSAPNLVFVNGGIFERSSPGSNRMNALKLDARTGRLIGAKRPGTAAQLARVLAPNVNRFSGKARQAIAAFVRANLSALDPSTFGRSPTGAGRTPTGPVATGGSRKPIDQDTGQHGKGSSVDTSPRGSSRRAAVDDGGSGAGGVCTDLNASVCNSSSARNAEILADNKKREVVREFQSLSRQDGASFGGLLAGILDAPARFAKAYSAFTSFLSGKIGSDVKSALGQARSALLQSIDAQPLSSQAKELMKAKLSNVKFRFTPNLRSLASIQAFVENCGPEGMADGAFAVPSVGEVVICPGLVFGAKGKGGDLVGHLVHVIAHEMGHHCGADEVPGSRTGFGAFKPIYRKLEQCYRTEFKQSDEKMGEIAADTWGVQALGVQLQGKSRGEALEMIRSAFAPLCGTPPSDEHPPGSFRVGIILGRDPKIREALGCDPPTENRPACTLGGTEPK